LCVFTTKKSDTINEKKDKLDKNSTGNAALFNNRFGFVDEEIVVAVVFRRVLVPVIVGFTELSLSNWLINVAHIPSAL